MSIEPQIQITEDFFIFSLASHISLLYVFLDSCISLRLSLHNLLISANAFLALVPAALLPDSNFSLSAVYVSNKFVKLS
tara:strand:- start:16537 stop:16773 length:237 start_codon:yes stop_codon:yes gene_type:complete